MDFILKIAFRLFLTMILAFLLTPLIKKLAFKIGAVDKPNSRRVNKVAMPTAGGLAIYIAFSISVLFFFPDLIPMKYAIHLVVSSGIVVVTGLIDDIFELKPRQKLLGVTLAALYVCFVFDVTVSTISLPHIGAIPLQWLSYPFTILWIAGLTNAINLVDGLDGLASGISIIALTTIGIIGYVASATDAVKLQVPLTIFILLMSVLGFFPFNFYPAKIFLGDTGALLLGFLISVLSIQGLKNATLITLITPLVILGVPITDTLFAMIRRKLNNRPISSADKMHLHHRLISLGFTHRGAVLTIYSMAIIFSVIAMLYMFTNTLATILLTIACLFGLQMFIELIGLTGVDKQPLLNSLKYLGNKAYRDSVKQKRKENKKKD
ncbi:glycosyltransferase family 4 protein [Vagococcus fluvialis]|jgi:UDP-GlcNAc:undecaprenyl-phosphate GlcNAc-1-phosphate transferase|uniref:Undecaprenyl/decaprenyl-phosphate alpha-N-acetylglucosaminyl 1-phosphate transferase n=1 Tax=Vagococcus fluvialis TaxID=2738 RepID=A0A7X6I273_9ENTE|nr:MraY family glycosyltransferase [Vagococcus fluvialis]NKC59772.1 undecaprenyl/decaprenyl-phosphate alpha-N-acetylglucosaminyl 1-phosphate transferase [Vagococcus fluvialis]NKC66895.1 undecaprenyl/decaprenyl-phosphate alpha-N-acetylglucosaminyl 1-phosphate transferase [Vagococcus fluvialis]NKD50669.1 undecaprenyl/decaprenyl-phosphate alpha-N-acetylglucosaminyl 1-phosphate transferase [Vagococcus fluvialis]